ncbi:MAG: hypothetical protein J5563_07060, partial [Clostridia bacterium]|nr:hypothetical protein [Clostridia bacterium]
MKLKIVFALLVAITVFPVFFCSCGNGKPDTETQAGSTETEKTDNTVRYRISYKEDFYIPLYDWYRKQQRTSDGKGSVYWNNKVAKTLSCNWINVFPSGKSRDGERGLPGAFLLDVDRIIEYTAKGLEDSHKLGIKIMTSAPISEVFPDTWTDWGYDPDLIRAVCTDGSLSPVYSNGVSHACHNNNILREKLFEYVEKVAKAGFDGCLFDGNSYGCSPGFFCQCEFCRESWGKYSYEKLGRELSLPKRSLDMSSDSMARAFFVWRMDSFSKLLVELRETGRKYNPDFEVYLNGMMYEIGEYYYFKNGLDVVTSEYSSNLDLGHDSTLFMFAMNEAITDKQLISFIQNYKNMFENDNEYYSVMAEAYAAGGAMCVAEVS